jgi:hypothetical protein
MHVYLDERTAKCVSARRHVSALPALSRFVGTKCESIHTVLVFVLATVEHVTSKSKPVERTRLLRATIDMRERTRACAQILRCQQRHNRIAKGRLCVPTISPGHALARFFREPENHKFTAIKSSKQRTVAPSQRRGYSVDEITSYETVTILSWGRRCVCTNVCPRTSPVSVIAITSHKNNTIVFLHSHESRTYVELHHEARERLSGAS